MRQFLPLLPCIVATTLLAISTMPAVCDAACTGTTSADFSHLNTALVSGIPSICIDDTITWSANTPLQIQFSTSFGCNADQRCTFDANHHTSWFSFPDNQGNTPLTVTFDSFAFINLAYAANSDGGIVVDPDTAPAITLIFRNCSFTSNANTAVRLSRATDTVQLISTSITGNLYTHNTPSISVARASVVMTDMTCADNYAPTTIGVCFSSDYCDNCNNALTITGSTFRNNTGKQGGAIASAGTGTVSISQSTFLANHATDYGGAIQAQLCNSFTLSYSNFTSNIGVTGAGAIALSNPGPAALDHVSFVANMCLRAGCTGGAANLGTNAGAVAMITNSYFEANLASGYGGALSGASKVLTIANTQFINNGYGVTNNSYTRGGIMDFGDCLSIRVNNSVFSGFAQGDGGSNAITLFTAEGANGDVAVTNCLFEHMYSGQNGPILELAGTTGSLSNTVFQNMVAPVADYGPVTIFPADSAPPFHAFVVRNCTFVDMVGSQGGALFSAQSLSVSSSTFRNCSAVEHNPVGGAIRVSFENIASPTKTVSISSCTFVDCASTGIDGSGYQGGGAVSIGNAKSVSVSQSSFVRCLSLRQPGGAIATLVDPDVRAVAQLTISNSNFTGCIGRYDGGAIAVDTQYQTTISQCQFAGNRAISSSNQHGGGAILVALNSTLAVANSVFSNNSSPDGYGGAIYQGANTHYDGATITLTSNQFLQNTAATGGAVAVGSRGPAQLALFKNNAFTSNAAPAGRGSAIYFLEDNDGEMFNIFVNCSFVNHTLSLPASTVVQFENQPRSAFVGCTFSNNTSAQSQSDIGVESDLTSNRYFIGLDNQYSSGLGSLRQTVFSNLESSSQNTIVYASNTSDYCELCRTHQVLCQAVNCNKSNPPPGDSGSSAPFAAIGGAIGGLVALLLILFVVRRYRKKRASKPEFHSATSSRATLARPENNTVIAMEPVVINGDNSFGVTSSLKDSPPAAPTQQYEMMGPTPANGGTDGGYVALQPTPDNDYEVMASDATSGDYLEMVAAKAQKDNMYELPAQMLRENLVMLVPRSINRASVEFKQEIGRGAFGQVFKASIPTIFHDQPRPGVPTSLTVAIKTLQEGADERSREDFASESQTLLQFQHTNIVTVLSVMTEAEPHLLILEYLPFGDLRGVIEKGANMNPCLHLTLAEKVHVLGQISSGMTYLASIRFVHRDLAARNCLVGPMLTVKIADFGLSRALSVERDYYRVETKGKLPVKWMAPESLEYRTFSTASDVWSFGCVMYEVFSNAGKLYEGMTVDAIIDYLRSGKRMMQPADCPDHLFTLVTRCWEQDANARPSFPEISGFFAIARNKKDQIRDVGLIVSDA
ncbi:TKL protein kinase [Capsaspora owczarzaki ATCC 30864]|uniref:TKL protein kinase n=2 Tax=Capsaspora owczarzaki (strain ATCC 30864) TaxID=595528 RepID=A0A0D2X170_CAPO3|nr:TKL protein kinase [Capsaspora owczarzaki ATCC 30864]